MIDEAFALLHALKGMGTVGMLLLLVAGTLGYAVVIAFAAYRMRRDKAL